METIGTVEVSVFEQFANENDSMQTMFNSVTLSESI